MLPVGKQKPRSSKSSLAEVKKERADNRAVTSRADKRVRQRMEEEELSRDHDDDENPKSEEDEEEEEELEQNEKENEKPNEIESESEDKNEDKMDEHGMEVAKSGDTTSGENPKISPTGKKSDSAGSHKLMNNEVVEGTSSLASSNEDDPSSPTIVEESAKFKTTKSTEECNFSSSSLPNGSNSTLPSDLTQLNKRERDVESGNAVQSDLLIIASTSSLPYDGGFNEPKIVGVDKAKGDRIVLSTITSPSDPNDLLLSTKLKTEHTKPATVKDTETVPAAPTPIVHNSNSPSDSTKKETGPRIKNIILVEKQRNLKDHIDLQQQPKDGESVKGSKLIDKEQVEILKKKNALLHQQLVTALQERDNARHSPKADEGFIGETPRAQARNSEIDEIIKDAVKKAVDKVSEIIVGIVRETMEGVLDRIPEFAPAKKTSVSEEIARDSGLSIADLSKVVNAQTMKARTKAAVGFLIPVEERLKMYKSVPKSAGDGSYRIREDQLTRVRDVVEIANRIQKLSERESHGWKENVESWCAEKFADDRFDRKGKTKKQGDKKVQEEKTKKSKKEKNVGKGKKSDRQKKGMEGKKGKESNSEDNDDEEDGMDSEEENDEKDSI